MENKEKLKIELEDLRIDLAREEQEVQARKKDADAMKERIRKRLETIDAYQAQIADKKARMERAKIEEEAFREMVTNSLTLVDEKVCGR
jgi:Trichohyalin-plectin-homology domain